MIFFTSYLVIKYATRYVVNNDMTKNSIYIICFGIAAIVHSLNNLYIVHV